eukprot:7387921-Prymnesium_polylepis.2
MRRTNSSDEPCAQGGSATSCEGAMPSSLWHAWRRSATSLPRKQTSAMTGRISRFGCGWSAPGTLVGDSMPRRRATSSGCGRGARPPHPPHRVAALVDALEQQRDASRPKRQLASRAAESCAGRLDRATRCCNRLAPRACAQEMPASAQQWRCVCVCKGREAKSVRMRT